MKMSFPFLILTGCVLAGLPTGGAVAWLLSGCGGTGFVSASLIPSASNMNPASGQPDKSQPPKITSNRRSRLLRLMDASTFRGSSGMAQAWKDAAGDPATRAWLAELWMSEDPAAFIRMFYGAAEGYFGEGEGRMVGDCIIRFAERNPHGALKLGLSLQPPSAGRWVTAQAILKIMETDTAEGLALAVRHPELRLNGDVNPIKIHVTAADLPKLMAMPRSTGVNDLIRKAMDDLPAQEAMKLTPQLNFYSRRSMTADISRRWVNEDPAAAQDFAVNGATEAQRISILECLGEKKVSGNPADAAAWAQQNLAGLARNNILEKAARKLEKTDPAAAESIRSRLPQHYNPQTK